MVATQETIEQVNELNKKYKYGFVTDVESEKAPLGLNEDIVRYISAKKKEPAWMLEWRLKAYRKWLTMDEPDWSMVTYPDIDFQDIHYYSAPKQKPKLNSLDEVDPEIRKTYDKLGIPIKEQESCLSPQFLTSSSDKKASFFSVPSFNLHGKRFFEEFGIFFFKFEPTFEEKPPFAFEFLCLGIGGLCSLSGFTSKGIKISFNLSLAI